MMFRRFISGNSLGEKKGEDEDGTLHDEEDEEYTEDEEEEDKDDEENIEAMLIPSDHEKKALLASFEAMRKESLFCDVAFISQGVLFRCHRVVVSSWSRWMRTFLCDSPEEEILSLDIFTPDAFQAVLDYMYGYPLQVTEQKADAILKVVRRLEMHKLEQQIWRYLITILNERNCDLFHELADRYDCPPLKLAAWRLLKEKIPGVTAFPTKKVLLEAANARPSALNGTGLIGPGDPLFNTLAVYHPQSVRRSAALGLLPSVFDEHDDNDDEDKSDDEEDGERRGGDRIPRLEELGDHLSAPATTVIQAWSARLKEVYQRCANVEAFEEDNLENLRLDDSTPNVKLSRVPRPKLQQIKSGENFENSGMLGKSDTTKNVNPMPSPTGIQRPPVVNVKGIQHQSQQGLPSPMAPNADAQVRTKTVKGIRTIDWEAELADFYDAVGAAQKIPGIPAILKAWAGKEEQMLQSLVKKYEGNIPRRTLAHLERVHQFFETQTEVSNNRSPGPRPGR